MTSFTRRALTLPASAAALATAALAAQALIATPAQSAVVRQPAGSSQGWRVSKTIVIRHKLVILFGIDAVSAKDAWAGGIVASGNAIVFHPLLEHWDGIAWRRVALPAKLVRHFTGQDTFGVVGASSASNVWAFAISGKYVRRVQGHWVFGRLPASKTGRTYVESVKVFSPTDVWVFGSKASHASSRPKFTPFAARFDGLRWTVVSVPGTGQLGSVSAIGPRNMWAITNGGGRVLGSGSDPVIVHWNGVAWQKVAPQPKMSRQTILAGILARSNTDVWVAGGSQNSKQGLSEEAWHWNGTAWIPRSPHSAATAQQYYISSLVPARGGMWALSVNLSGTTRAWRYSDGAWSAPVRLPSSWDLFLLAGVPHTSSIWGIGERADDNGGLIVLHGPVPR